MMHQATHQLRLLLISEAAPDGNRRWTSMLQVRAHHSIFAATSPTTGPVRPRWTSSRQADERSYRHARAVLTRAGDGGHRTVAVRQRKPTMSASAGEASMGRPFYRIFLAATRFSRRCVSLCPPHDADFRCA
jgi:hypothetical protein